MRKIILRVVKMENANGQQIPPLIYGNAYSQIVCSGDGGGFTVLEMAAALAIKKAFDQAMKQNIEAVYLEESEWMFLAEKLKTHKFPFASVQIMELVESALTAQKVDPNER